MRLDGRGMGLNGTQWDGIIANRVESERILSERARIVEPGLNTVKAGSRARAVLQLLAGAGQDLPFRISQTFSALLVNLGENRIDFFVERLRL
jgi:hypothetical protein